MDGLTVPDNTHKITVFAVAPFEPVRVGLRDGFASKADFEIVGDCATLAELVSDERFPSADVLLVDASALGAGNAGVYASIQDRLPELKVLFIGTAAEAASFSVETLRVVTRLSAVGFLYRDGTIDRVIDGVRLVASGAFVCETDVMRALLSDLATRGSKAVREAPAPVPELSAREREVLALVASGLSNREIGSRLYVSEGTVKAHVSHVMSKLGLERRTELVRFAMSRGLDAAA